MEHWPAWSHSDISSIVDLMDFRKFNRPPATVLQNFSVTEVYLKRARKFLGKDMRSNWRTDLDIERLESRRCWANLSEVHSITRYHLECYEGVPENCMTCPALVKPSDLKDLWLPTYSSKSKAVAP